MDDPRRDPAHTSPTTPAPRSGRPTSCPSRAPPRRPRRRPRVPRSPPPARSLAAEKDHSAPSTHYSRHPDSPPTHAPPPTPDDRDAQHQKDAPTPTRPYPHSTR